MDSLNQYFQNYGADVTFYKVTDGRLIFAFPTDLKRNKQGCDMLYKPQWGNCHIDGAGLLLQHLYGNKLIPPKDDLDYINYGKLLTFDQSEFNNHASWDKNGYIYVPNQC